MWRHFTLSILEWVTVFEWASHLSISPSHRGQLSLLSSVGREMSTSQSAVILCSRRGRAHSTCGQNVWVAGKTVWSLVNTCCTRVLQWWVMINCYTNRWLLLLHSTSVTTNIHNHQLILMQEITFGNCTEKSIQYNSVLNFDICYTSKLVQSHLYHFFSVLVKRMTGKSISEMNYFVSSGNLNSINQPLALL